MALCKTETDWRQCPGYCFVLFIFRIWNRLWNNHNQSEHDFTAFTTVHGDPVETCYVKLGYLELLAFSNGIRTSVVFFLVSSVIYYGLSWTRLSQTPHGLELTPLLLPPSPPPFSPLIMYSSIEMTSGCILQCSSHNCLDIFLYTCWDREWLLLLTHSSDPQCNGWCTMLFCRSDPKQKWAIRSWNQDYWVF